MLEVAPPPPPPPPPPGGGGGATPPPFQILKFGQTPKRKLPPLTSQPPPGENQKTPPPPSSRRGRETQNAPARRCGAGPGSRKVTESRLPTRRPALRNDSLPGPVCRRPRAVRHRRDKPGGSCCRAVRDGAAAARRRPLRR